MWSLCRSFHLAKLGLAADFVTSLEYVHVPLEKEEALALQQQTGAPTLRECMTLEYFLCGCNNGDVAVVSIPPASDDELKSQERFVGSTGGAKICSTIHSHKSDVLAMATHGTLAATAGDDGEVFLFFMHPNVGEEIASLPHPTGVRTVVLWEGPSSWADLPGEESIVYVFTGCNDGLARMWRVDVMAKTFFLHSMFAISVVGTHGDAADGSAVENDRHGPQRRTLASPIYSLMLDGEARLVFGNERGKWAAFNLDTLVHRSEEVASDEECAKLRDEKMLDTPVWALSGAAIESVSNQAQNKDILSKVKTKHREVVCGGKQLGVVSDFINHDNGEKLVTSTFPGLKNPQRWPLKAVRPAILSSLVANAHENGPVFALLSLREGRFASGGADGLVQVWEWDSTHQKYSLVHQLSHHTDLVKSLHAVRLPDVFVSTSHDGTCREWHLFDDPEGALCHATLFVGAHDNLYHKVDHNKMAVGAAAVFSPAKCMFVVGLFEAIVRVYAMLPVASCELPPGWFYNGFNSIQLYDPEEEALKQKAQEEQLKARRELFDQMAGSLEDHRPVAAESSTCQLLPSDSSSDDDGM